MNLSKRGELELKIESLKRETGLSDKEVKKLFIETYLLEDEEKSPDEIFGEFLRRGAK